LLKKDDMKRNTKVSVICISYNQENFIRDALDGFVKQKTSFDVEYIIADDASSDSTPKIIQEYDNKYPGVFRILPRDKNLGAVNNFLDAIKHAKGQYISLCEGDDYWEDAEKLEKQVSYMDSHPECTVTFHRVNVIYEGSERKNFVFPDVEDKTWYSKQELLSTNFIPTNSVMYRAQKYDTMPTNVMPLDWYLHLYHASFGEVHFIDEIMSVYRKHENGMWWEYDLHRDEIWKKYGLEHLALWDEIRKFFLDDKVALKKIDDAFFRMMDIAAGLDDELLKNALEIYKHRALDFIRWLRQQVAMSQQYADDYKKELLRVGDEKHTLEVQLEVSKQKLRQIHQSKTWRLHKGIQRLYRKTSDKE
jgi:glycosyltransferase involved in cell wall biosynthesis